MKKPALLLCAFLSVALLSTQLSCGLFSPYSVGSPDPLYSEFVLAWDLADAFYAPFIVHPGVDWDGTFSSLASQAASLSERDQLLSLLSAMFAQLEDGQVLLRTFQGTTRPHDPGYFENFDGAVWQGYMDDWAFQYWPDSLSPYGFAFATPDSSIGYVYLPGMGDGYLWTEFLYMTANVRECSGVILDLRNCSGIGSYMNAYNTSGRFINQGGVTALYRQFRVGPGRYDMEEPKPVLTSKQGSWQFSVPVVVLAGRGTDGAGEVLAMLMATQQNVTLMGDVTFGAPDISRVFTLNDTSPFESLKLYLPEFVIYDPAMNPVVGAGIEPDIAVPASPGDFAAGVDPVLEAAVAYLSR